MPPFARRKRVGLLARERRDGFPRKTFRASPAFASGCPEGRLTYSGGTAPALDRLPCYALAGTRSVYSVFRARFMRGLPADVNTRARRLPRGARTILRVPRRKHAASTIRAAPPVAATRGGFHAAPASPKGA